MPRRNKEPPKSHLPSRFHAHVWDQPERAGGDDFVVAPASYLDLGADRALEARARLNRLRRRFDEIDAELSQPDLPFTRQHALADEVDDAWWGMCRCPLNPQGRLAMQFLEALRLVAPKRRDAEILRALAKERAELRLDKIDRSALGGREGQLGVRRAELRSLLETGEISTDAALEYCDDMAAEMARRTFAFAHSGYATTLTLGDWWRALDAWDARAPKKRRGALPSKDLKWTVLARLLGKVGIWSGKSENLQSKWNAWCQEGFSFPVFLRGATLQTPADDTGNTQPTKSKPHRQRTKPASSSNSKPRRT